MSEVTYNTGASHEGFDPTAMMQPLAKATADVKAKLAAMTGQEEVSITDMFEMQMLMNSLSQLTEMSGSVISASHSATMSLARNVKG